MKRALPIFTLTVLAGCVSSAPPTTMPHHLTEAEASLVETTIARGLKDPQSAKFGALVSSRSDAEVTWVCGTVNAKNGFGGYTGMSPFMGFFPVSQNMFIITSIGNLADEQEYTLQQCRNYNIVPPL